MNVRSVPFLWLQLLVLFVLVPTSLFSQLVPQWIVSGRSQFTNPKTIVGIAGCAGGFYLTGGMRDLDWVLQVSNDAGMTWTERLSLKQHGHNAIQPPLGRPFAEVVVSSVSRPAPEVCFAYGWGRYELDGVRLPFLLRSLDSGVTWSEILLEDSARGVNDACLAMRDTKHGIRTGGYIDEQHPVLYRTSDGGDSWSTVNIPFVDYRTKSISYAKDGTIFAVEWRTPMLLFRSTDDGGTWEYRGVLPSARVPSFVMANLGYQAYGIATGGGDMERDVIARTTDGGVSWETILDTIQDPPYGLTAISAADEKHAIAVGRLGKLFHTTNGGANWERAARPFYMYDPAFAEVLYPDTMSAVAGALFHIATYTGGRTLQPPVASTMQGANIMQRTAMWTKVEGAMEYQLELAEDYHSSTIQFEIFDEHPYKQSGWITGLSLPLDPWLRLNRDYFVRVRARGGVYTSDWSYPVKFYTDQSTEILVDAAPAAGSIALYPQPAGETVSVHVSGLPPSTEWFLRVQDKLGRTLALFDGISTSDGEIQRLVEVRNIPSGVHYIIFSCGGIQQVRTFTVLR
ncbi:MAG: hypothetical protein KFF77_04450 [Bacteroidetes bacterium]|nr:hypothetical protein [Bacteroidota bacterium]